MSTKETIQDWETVADEKRLEEHRNLMKSDLESSFVGFFKTKPKLLEFPVQSIPEPVLEQMQESSVSTLLSATNSTPQPQPLRRGSRVRRKPLRYCDADWITTPNDPRLRPTRKVEEATPVTMPAPKESTISSPRPKLKPQRKKRVKKASTADSDTMTTETPVKEQERVEKSFSSILTQTPKMKNASTQTERNYQENNTSTQTESKNYGVESDPFTMKPEKENNPQDNVEFLVKLHNFILDYLSEIRRASLKSFIKPGKVEEQGKGTKSRVGAVYLSFDIDLPCENVESKTTDCTKETFGNGDGLSEEIVDKFPIWSPLTPATMTSEFQDAATPSSDKGFGEQPELSVAPAEDLEYWLENNVQDNIDPSHDFSEDLLNLIDSAFETDPDLLDTKFSPLYNYWKGLNLNEG